MCYSQPRPTDRLFVCLIVFESQRIIENLTFVAEICLSLGAEHTKREQTSKNVDVRIIRREHSHLSLVVITCIANGEPLIFTHGFSDLIQELIINPDA